MGLVLYRRHLKSCKVHKLGLPPRAVRVYMDCECPIWIYGRTNTELIPRQTTGQTDLAAAEAIRKAYLADAKDETIHGLKLSECIEKYLASRQDQLGNRTHRQHQLLLTRLQDFCDRRGAFHAQELTVDLLEDFKVTALAGLASTSKATAVAKLRCFLSDALRRGWITEPLAAKVSTHRATYDQKEPYSNEEIGKILDGARNLNGGTHGFAAHPETFRLLLELMLETGMRVGDAVRYNPRQVVRGEYLWIYTYSPQKQKLTKSPKTVEAYLPDKLKRSIDSCKWLSAKLPFYWKASANNAYIANQVYERMQALGARCGVEDCRPHRLRDTFAVRKLLAGVPLDDVSRLLGHSSVKVTELYYAKWVSARKLRLERIVAESLMDPQ